MIKLWYAFLGVIFGVLFGTASTIFVVSACVNGEGLGIVIFTMLFAPVGMVVGAAIGIPVFLNLLNIVRAKKSDGVTQREVGWYIARFVLCCLGLIVGLVWTALQIGPPPSDL